jgi:hypothetical protein
MPVSLESPPLLLVDVDGVVTDEHARVDVDVVRRFVALFEAGVRAAFITGRSRAWLEQHLMPALRECGADLSSPSLVFAAEMGALRRGRRTGGAWRLSPEHAVGPELRSKLIPLVEREGLEGLVEWDATKEATATFESIHRPEMPGHAQRARDALASLLPHCSALAEPYGCRAAMSTYALDVLAASLSKRVGATFAFEELRAGTDELVVVLGDSAGDLIMANAAQELDAAQVEFHWFGRGPAPDAGSLRVVPASVPHADGTRLILQQLQAQFSIT